MSTADEPLLDVERRNPDVIKKRARVFMLEAAYKWTAISIALILIGLLLYDIKIGADAREQILSCTIPTGECYERSQERGNELVEDLYQQGITREGITRQIIVLASACAGDDRNRSARDIEVCVNERLDRRHRIHLPEKNN